MEGLNKSPRIRKVTAIPFALKEKIREGAVVPPQAKAYIKAMKAKKEEEMVISVEDATFEIDDNDIITFKGTSGKLISNEDFEKRREAMRQKEEIKEESGEIISNEELEKRREVRRQREKMASGIDR